ncbi:hypothetical protein OIU84_022081 [Salix udensis]|uniref:Uncharacterized protein n=1 Tax=Salix udensis TaxID=889485 RepID=A0AAD6KQ23_9ROSI|nr:hypothetical protein OIU84_022081 [Salix udensis]
MLENSKQIILICIVEECQAPPKQEAWLLISIMQTCFRDSSRVAIWYITKMFWLKLEERHTCYIIKEAVS